MACWFVSRHPGAITWARTQGIAADHWVPHLPPHVVKAGDTVVGTLPIHLAAQVCDRGARYLHLRLDLSSERRGRELDADDMARADARLEAYHVRAVVG